MKNLLVDLNNLVYSLRHAKYPQPERVKNVDKFVKETLFITALNSIIWHSRRLGCGAVVICADAPNVWRKSVYREYKENDTDSIEDPYHKHVIAAADMLMDFMKDFTASLVLKVPSAEADDIIAVWCQESDSENVVFSSDRDFVQLINERTTVYSHVQDKFRTSEDPGFDLFVKCIRGDVSDNIRSAYPRVRTEALKRAWEDDYAMLNLMETVLKDGRKVGDAMSFNIGLIDLTAQPDHIRSSILKCIEKSESGDFKQVQAMRFFGENGLKERVDILETGSRILRTSPIFRTHK